MPKTRDAQIYIYVNCANIYVYYCMPQPMKLLREYMYMCYDQPFSRKKAHGEIHLVYT